MGILEIVLVIVTLIYIIYIIQLIIGFGKISNFERTDLKPTTTFSIIIPIRNEGKNLHQLLESIADLNYPKDLFEVIVVDDFSKDNSITTFNKWRMENGLIHTTLLENLRLSNSPKKDALSRAIPVVKNNWIITTDGDCILKNNWLRTFDQFIQKNNYEMVAGSVIYKTKNNWFHYFQQLDLLSLQATTIGSFGIGKPFMCNGANFAYTKNLFQDLGGFGGIKEYASGDDVLLLQKAVAKYPEKVGFIKNKSSIVITKPENDLFKLFMQRVRWASKTKGYKSNYAKSLAVIVLFMNLFVVIGFALALLGFLHWPIYLGSIAIKYIIDYLLLLRANFYLLRGKFIIPFASAVLYPVFVSIVGIYSLYGSFTWKNRTFAK